MGAHSLRRVPLIAALLLSIVACTPTPPLIPTSEPTSVETTASYEALRGLPAPTIPVPVAVYSYPDLTGQLKPSETISSNSRAVTQGAVWMLVKSLKDAGGGRWFKVIQRANLENLLKGAPDHPRDPRESSAADGKSPAPPALPALCRHHSGGGNHRL